MSQDDRDHFDTFPVPSFEGDHFDPDDDEDVCEICLGEGTIECDSCEGSGADCAHCKRGNCETCDGEGYVPCPECQG